MPETIQQPESAGDVGSTRLLGVMVWRLRLVCLLGLLTILVNGASMCLSIRRIIANLDSRRQSPEQSEKSILPTSTNDSHSAWYQSPLVSAPPLLYASAIQAVQRAPYLSWPPQPLGAESPHLQRDTQESSASGYPVSYAGGQSKKLLSNRSCGVTIAPNE